MEKITLVLKAIIGYAGSSESPEKMSMRFMGVITAIIAKFAPSILLLAGMFVTLPEGATPQQLVDSWGPVIQAFVFVFAGVMYLVGLVRAVIQSLKTKDLGALVGMRRI